MNSIRDRVEAFGLKLPSPPAPRGAYAAAMIHGGIAYVSGQVSRIGDETITGPVDDHTAPVVIRDAAQASVLRALGTLAALEDDLVFDRLLFLRGFIYSKPGFCRHSSVLDHASELLHGILGEAGRHARSAVGVASLPSLGLMEVELVAAMRPRLNNKMKTIDESP